MAQGPLAGIRIVTIADQYPSGHAGLVMADLGAEVTIVEAPGGDPLRRVPPAFATLHRGKRAVALDLKAPEGRQTLLRLADAADILVESMKPGVAARLGCDAQMLRGRNPRLIHISLTGYGQTGPRAQLPGHDPCYQAWTGLSHGAVPGDAVPALAAADTAGAMYAVIAALACLHRRNITGEGAAVDLSMTDALMSWVGPLVTMGAMGVPVAPDWPAYGYFTCADGKTIVLGVAHEDHFWARLADAIGLDDVAALTAPERLGLAGELKGRLAGALASRPIAEWAELLTRAMVPWAAATSFAAAACDPHFAERGLFLDQNGMRFVLQPLVIDGERPSSATPLPPPLSPE